MIRAIIVDDELPAIDRFKKLLRTYPDIDIVGEAHDGLSALTLVEEKKPDLLFLDIDMPELNGLDVAKTLGVDGPRIIFTTAYDDRALEAFESNTIDYLVKPINSHRLDLAVEKIRKTAGRDHHAAASLVSQLRDQNPARLAVKVGSKYEVFDPAQIAVAQAKDHYTSLLVEGREMLCDDSLDAVVQRLDPQLFIRVHRGAALNIKYLKELKHEGDRKYTAIVMSKEPVRIPVSRERLPLLKKFLGL